MHQSLEYSLITHRLKAWMMEASEPCRSELSQVLFPLFVHLYLELVTATGRTTANRFFKRHYQVIIIKFNAQHEVKCNDNLLM